MVTDPIGMNVKNVPDPEQQAAARLASQGRSTESGVSGIPGGVVVEGTITARQGTHLIGSAADGSPGMPAAAGATCVGGQGVHWTCATPAPTGPERVPFIDDAEWEEHITAAEALLHVYRPSFDGAPQAQAILERIRDEFAPDGITVRPLPVAADPREPTARCGGAARTSSSGRWPRARTPTGSRCGRRRSASGWSGRATAPSAPSCATSGRAPRRRSGPTSSCWPPTRSARRSCCGRRASAPRRSAATSPSTRCCSAWWPCVPTSSRPGRSRPVRWTRSGPSSPSRSTRSGTPTPPR